MARKHTKSISFYLSEQDHKSIKDSAKMMRMTVKDYLLSLHHKHIGKGEKDKLDIIIEKLDDLLASPSVSKKPIIQLDEITNSPLQPDVSAPTVSAGDSIEQRFNDYVKNLRTARQQANASKIYNLLKEAGEMGITLQKARSQTSTAAKNTLLEMIDRGIAFQDGRRFCLSQQ